MARTKPHVKVHVSVSNHRKTAKAWFNPETRGMLIELWRIAAEKYAGRTQDEVALTPTDMRAIAGRSRLDHNRIALSKLVDAVEYRMRSDGLLTYIIIRNFSKKQGWDDKNSTPPIPTPNPIPISESKSEEKRGETAPAARPRAPVVTRIPKTPAPDRLSKEDSDRLSAWCLEREPWAVHRLAELEAACLDHFRAKGERMADWSATVRNWVSRERSVFGRDRGPPPRRGDPLPMPVSMIRPEDLLRKKEIPF